ARRSGRGAARSRRQLRDRYSRDGADRNCTNVGRTRCAIAGGEEDEHRPRQGESRTPHRLFGRVAEVKALFLVLAWRALLERFEPEKGRSPPRVPLVDRAVPLPCGSPALC